MSRRVVLLAVLAKCRNVSENKPRPDHVKLESQTRPRRRTSPLSLYHYRYHLLQYELPAYLFDLLLFRWSSSYAMSRRRSH